MMISESGMGGPKELPELLDIRPREGGTTRKKANWWVGPSKRASLASFFLSNSSLGCFSVFVHFPSFYLDFKLSLLIF